jgi:hypothetical protein
MFKYVFFFLRKNNHILEKNSKNKYIVENEDSGKKESFFYRYPRPFYSL